MGLKWPVKDPQENLRYDLDMSELIESRAVVSFTWGIPTGVTTYGQGRDGSDFYIWIGGGTAGQTYTFTLNVHCDDGSIFERDISLKVKNK